jgi:hypothetical protein
VFDASLCQRKAEMMFLRRSESIQIARDNNISQYKHFHLGCGDGTGLHDRGAADQEDCSGSLSLGGRSNINRTSFDIDRRLSKISMKLPLSRYQKLPPCR